MSRSKSKAIEEVLIQFPSLKPLEIEKLLAERGIEVDRNLIVVARHRFRERRKRFPEDLVLVIVKTLISRRPDLMARLFSEFEVVVRDAWSAVSPSLSPEEVADRLAALIDARPPQETVIGRLSRAAMRVLDRHPHLKRSVAVVSGVKPDDVSGMILIATGLDAATDEELEAMALRHLEKTFPPGTTVEEVARAYFLAVQRQSGAVAGGKQLGNVSEKGRAERIGERVVGSFGGGGINAGAVIELARQLLGVVSDWNDEAIAERILSSLQLGIEPDEQPSLWTEGLAVRGKR
ncbi:hypothetical protein J0H58_13360 [bacterium]|nr:hypothetical protein [bacterium]